jgi:hypothetical protein
MYAISSTREVNPPGLLPTLTADQVWCGLVMKAENAVPFVPAMAHCRVLERYDDGFLREIVLRGVRMTERITLTPPVEVHFRRIDAQGFDGWVSNLISESERGLMLTFTFAVGFPGVAPHSDEEKRRGDEVKASYLSAVDSTLDAVRRLAGSNRL